MVWEIFRKCHHLSISLINLLFYRLRDIIISIFKRKRSDIMRRREGEETWHRLLEWDRGQAASERLATTILSSNGFQNVDPSHPLGGKDGLKDMVLSYQGQKWIGAVYFPRGQQDFTTIKQKVVHDIEGVKKNHAHGLAFVTNQELRLSERTALSEINPEIDVQLYHLERIATLLNTPSFYGIRMEFLDIEMSKEEQLSFFATQNQKISTLQAEMEKLTIGLENFKIFHQLKQTKELAENENDFYVEERRSIEEIVEASGEFLEKVWFNRHLVLKYRIETGKESVDPEIWKGALNSAQKVIEKYGEENLGPYSDFEWGMINGKLSALRWVLGEDWDMLDT